MSSATSRQGSAAEGLDRHRSADDVEPSDTAEIMVDPDGDGDNVNYYEIQINPQNKVFKSPVRQYNKPKTEPQGPFGHEDWDPKMKTAVVVKGTIDNSADKDEGYVVEAAIPWKAFEKGAKNASAEARATPGA